MLDTCAVRTTLCALNFGRRAGRASLTRGGGTTVLDLVVMWCGGLKNV